MLQRIQSLYLLIVTVLQTVLFFSRQATVMRGTEEAIFQLSSMWYMAVLIGATALLAFFTIFRFRYRKLQVRLSIFNCIMLTALQLIIVYMLLRAGGVGDEIRYSLTAIFPAISLVLTYLAIRATAKDELLIRSLNRLR